MVTLHFIQHLDQPLSIKISTLYADLSHWSRKRHSTRVFHIFAALARLHERMLPQRPTGASHKIFQHNSFLDAFFSCDRVEGLGLRISNGLAISVSKNNDYAWKLDITLVNMLEMYPPITIITYKCGHSLFPINWAHFLQPQILNKHNKMTINNLVFSKISI